MSTTAGGIAAFQSGHLADAAGAIPNQTRRLKIGVESAIQWQHRIHGTTRRLVGGAGPEPTSKAPASGADPS